MVHRIRETTRIPNIAWHEELAVRSSEFTVVYKAANYNKNSFEEIKKHSNNDCNDESDDEEKRSATLQT